MAAFTVPYISDIYYLSVGCGIGWKMSSHIIVYLYLELCYFDRNFHRRTLADRGSMHHLQVHITSTFQYYGS